VNAGTKMPESDAVTNESWTKAALSRPQTEVAALEADTAGSPMQTRNQPKQIFD